ncbi:MAG TPA: alpha/beta hydrolase [Syntrophales bacterium]|nr:alpha/beta hydrolase [Syntrophales bacterium]HRS86707.1 alpha/beta hydrolase [Syntrophales bacterium]
MPYFVTDDHVRLYYEERGEGRPVVLIHGLTANRRHFRKQVPALAGRFRVVTLDLRGHGDSEAPRHGLTIPRLARDLRELMAYLGLEGTALVGWSMGAHVIFEYVRQFGCEGLGKVVIIDMSPRLMKAPDWSGGLPGLFSQEAGDFGPEDNLKMLEAMLTDWGEYSRVVVQRILGRPPRDDRSEEAWAREVKGGDDLPWLYAEALRNDPLVVLALWVSMTSRDYRSVVGRITVPCLVAYGADGGYYPLKNYAFLEKELPRGRVVPFAGCAHALHIQDPEAFNAELIAFLEAPEEGR